MLFGAKKKTENTPRGAARRCNCPYWVPVIKKYTLFRNDTYRARVLQITMYIPDHPKDTTYGAVQFFFSSKPKRLEGIANIFVNT